MIALIFVLVVGVACFEKSHLLPVELAAYRSFPLQAITVGVLQDSDYVKIEVGGTAKTTVSPMRNDTGNFLFAERRNWNVHTAGFSASNLDFALDGIWGFVMGTVVAEVLKTGKTDVGKDKSSRSASYVCDFKLPWPTRSFDLLEYFYNVWNYDVPNTQFRPVGGVVHSPVEPELHSGHKGQQGGEESDTDFTYEVHGYTSPLAPRVARASKVSAPLKVVLGASYGVLLDRRREAGASDAGESSIRAKS